MRTRNRRSGLLAVAACVALTLTACGDSSIDDETEANEQRQEELGDCGELNLAVNPWVGFEADAYVVGHIAQEELGCTVNYKDLKEDVSWQGFGTGEVDVVIEDWGHPDLEKKFFAEEGDGSADGLRPDRQRRDHRLVRPAVARGGAPGGSGLQQPQRLRVRLRDVGDR